MPINRRLVLARRPDTLPDLSTFGRDDGPIPEPREGEFLVRNVFLPLDPGMRPVLSDVRIGADEFEPLALGALVGYLTVGQVVRSRDPEFAPGDWVTDILFWQDYALSTALTARKFDPQELSPTTWLGILGVPGLSAWTGLITLAAPQPGETILITSAAGAVGSIAGQIARNLGCRVVGLAGGDAKCRFVKEELGFAEVIDYRSTTDIGAAVRHACPHGVDVLFDNVGNAMVDALLPAMRRGGRITLCGQIADYHLPPAARPGIKNTNRFITHRLTMRGLFVYDHAKEFPRALSQMTQWMREKKLFLAETIVPGFDQLPAAFVRLFTGEGMGRSIVRIDVD